MYRLLAALGVEIAVFAVIAPNFLTTANLFESDAPERGTRSARGSR
jgi:hypothetical protein